MFVLIAFLHPTQCTYLGIPSQFPAAVAKFGNHIISIDMGEVVRVSVTVSERKGGS